MTGARLLLLAVLALAAAPLAAQTAAPDSGAFASFAPRPVASWVAQVRADSLRAAARAADSLAAVGRSHEAAYRPGDALDAYRAALAAGPSREAALAVARLRTWAGGADEALRAIRPWADRLPDDADVQAAFAFALHAAGRTEAARRQYGRALALAPDSAALALSGGELERWSGRWTVGRRRLRRALELGLAGPDADRARRLLHGIRDDHGPRAGARVRLLDDSNGLTRLRVPLAASRHSGGPWRIDAGLESLVLAQGGASAEALEGRAGLSWAPTGRATVDAQLGAHVGRRVSPIARAAASYRWHGRRYRALTARLATAPYDAGPRALDVRATDTALDGYADLHPRVAVFGTALRRWISDGNRLDLASGTARLRLAGAQEDTRPAPFVVFASGSVTYETAARLLADAVPYWTPDRLTTLAAGLDADAELGRHLLVGGTLGVSQQRGPLGRATSLRLGARASLDAGPVELGVSARRDGSAFYRVREVSLSVLARW